MCKRMVKERVGLVVFFKDVLELWPGNAVVSKALVRGQGGAVKGSWVG